MILNFPKGISLNKKYTASASACREKINIIAEEPAPFPEDGTGPEYALRTNKQVLALIGCDPPIEIKILAHLAKKPLDPRIQWWFHIEELSSRIGEMSPQDLLLPDFSGTTTLGKTLIWQGARFPRELLEIPEVVIHHSGKDLAWLQSTLAKDSRDNNPAGQLLATTPEFTPGARVQAICDAICVQGEKEETQPSKYRAKRKDEGISAFHNLFTARTLSREEIIRICEAIPLEKAAELETQLETARHNGIPLPPLFVEKVIKAHKLKHPKSLTLTGTPYIKSLLSWEAEGAGGEECQERLKRLLGTKPNSNANPLMWMKVHTINGIHPEWVALEGRKLFWQAVTQTSSLIMFKQHLMQCMASPVALEAVNSAEAKRIKSPGKNNPLYNKLSEWMAKII